MIPAWVGGSTRRAGSQGNHPAWEALKFCSPQVLQKRHPKGVHHGRVRGESSRQAAAWRKAGRQGQGAGLECRRVKDEAEN